MADFTYVPHRVEPGKLVYNVIKSEMEGFRKKRRLITTDPQRTWKLIFRGQSNSERALLLAHYSGQYGDYSSFTWTTMPSHIGSETPVVNYLDYQENCIGNDIWEIEMTFEEELT